MIGAAQRVLGRTIRFKHATTTFARHQSRGRVTGFDIDRSGLAKGPIEVSNEPIKGKEAMSELGNDLKAYIEARGPITVHDFMSQCLNHGAFGYYQNSTEKIGGKGDFVTAPEISQLFGELLCVWLVSVWKGMGEPGRISLVEMGPGRGTLMRDVLRTAAKFPKFHSSLVVHLVELSETMREAQRSVLDCRGKTPGDTKVMQTKDGIRVHWHYFLTDVPVGPSLYIGQEFLDAFPVHQFALTSKGWREKMVDLCVNPESPFNFRCVLAPGSTPASKLFLDELPSTSASSSGSDAMSEGDVIEVSPLAIGAVEDIARRISVHSGAALFVDYGEATPMGDTLRGFSKHSLVDAMSSPGNVDVTCDVDFATLASRAERAGAKVAPLATQGEFLMRLGLVPRLERLVESDATTDAQATALVDAARTLVSPEGANMGAKFKVLSFHHEALHVEGFE